MSLYSLTLVSITIIVGGSAMAQNVTEAINEVNLIKKVIDRTQNDFSRIANFFISIGLINTVTYLLYAVTLQFIKGMDHVNYGAWKFFRGLNYISIIGYIALFLVYRRKLKKRNNDLSLSLIHIWGALLIGGEIFRIFFSILNSNEQNVYFYQKTLTFLFPMIGCFVLGFVIQDKLIQWVSSAVVVLYLISVGTGIEIKIASFHGNPMNLGLDMILTGITVSAGMILLGIYLKRKGDR